MAGALYDVIVTWYICLANLPLAKLTRVNYPCVTFHGCVHLLTVVCFVDLLV